jgi:ParB/RepB/Spo0J family partition protein
MSKESQAKTKQDPFDDLKKGFQNDLARKTSECVAESAPPRPRMQMKALDPTVIRLDENVRRNIDAEAEDFQELLNSVREKGILQSLLVEERVHADGTVEYVCVEGHRRTLAACMAPLKQVPCMVKRYADLTSRIEDALAADQKKFLNLVDRAEAFRNLQSGGRALDEIGKIVNLDVRTVQRYLKISTWPEEAKALLQNHPEAFSAKDVFHNFVQKSVEGKALIDGLRQRINAKATVRKPGRKGASSENDELEIHSKVLLLQMKRSGIEASIRQGNEGVVATLHFNSQSLKDFVDRFKRLETLHESDRPQHADGE